MQVSPEKEAIIDRMIEMAMDERDHATNALDMLVSQSNEKDLMEAAQRANPGLDMAAEMHNAIDNARKTRDLLHQILAAKREEDTAKVDILKARLAELIDFG